MGVPGQWTGDTSRDCALHPVEAETLTSPCGFRVGPCCETPDWGGMLTGKCSGLWHPCQGCHGTPFPLPVSLMPSQGGFVSVVGQAWSDSFGKSHLDAVRAGRGPSCSETRPEAGFLQF